MIYLVTNSKELFTNEAYTIISVEDSLKLLEPLEIVGLDTETEGFSPFLKKLLLLQLGNRDFQIVIDCTTVDISLYKPYLESSRLFLGWNLKFDVKFLFYHNIIPKNLYDGYLAEKMIWLGYPSGMHGLSLKAAGENYLGIELDKSVRGEIIWRKQLSDRIIKYSADDVKYLEDIYQKQTDILYKRGQKNAILLENRAILPIAYFEYCGVKLDVERWKLKIKRDQEKMNESLSMLNSWVITHLPNSSFCNKNLQGDLFSGFNKNPVCVINWDSPKQVIELFKLLKFNLSTLDKKTKTIKESVESDIIKKQINLSSIAPIYLKYKEAQKVCSTYGDNFLDLINPKTGRIHTNFFQIGTDTHRLSSGGGDDKEVIPGKIVPLVNLQNLPSDKDTRECFIAEPGNCWISADFSGEESVILANISKDIAMLDIFKNKGDLHSLVAKMLYPNELANIPVNEVKSKRPDLRKAAKAPEFTFAYGGDANTLANRDNIPLADAKIIEDNYMRGFPGVAKYQKHQRNIVMKLGYINTCPEIGYRVYIYDFDTLSSIQSKFNYKFWKDYKVLKTINPTSTIVQEVRHYFQRKSASERQSINYPIQSRASAIYKIASVNLFKWVVERGYFGVVKFCIPVHDEWNIEAPKEISEEVTKQLYNCMIDAGKFICKDIPLDADISRLSDGSLPTYWIH